MMEDNGTREQTGALPLEGSFLEAVPGTVALWGAKWSISAA